LFFDVNEIGKYHLKLTCRVTRSRFKHHLIVVIVCWAKRSCLLCFKEWKYKFCYNFIIKFCEESRYRISISLYLIMLSKA